MPTNNEKNRRGFDPDSLDKTVIAIPLLKAIEENEKGPHKVIIDLNLNFKGGRSKARSRVRNLLKQVITDTKADTKISFINEVKSKSSQQYIFAQLEGKVIWALRNKDVEKSNNDPAQKAIYHIWPDFEINPLTYISFRTVKADAARISFSALGKDIVWAVMDSGIDKNHPHFKLHSNLEVPYHRDFTVEKKGDEKPRNDFRGHGTHVAGIIAGELNTKDYGNKIFALTKYKDQENQVVPIDHISGMAPQCKLVSIKVLNDAGRGEVSNIIAGIEYIQHINNYGRDIHIHGVNISVGYTFEPEWFACGQSPLCIEIDRLVKSGVVVVVAAGNTGYGYARTILGGELATGMNLSINDPGNAELAITVGATHRDMPHIYGVSYFSSKGPTGDGRLKPDLVAPGEKIISCAAKDGFQHRNAIELECQYIEDSGTSMAAPHVSGVIASFLSIRREFIGRPEEIKQIFLSTATDLKRERHFQGYGLIDLMRAIQSV